MSEVIVRLVGGLGNQMFQYAAGSAVATRNKAKLTLDLSWFGTDPERQYALAPFKIEAGTSIRTPKINANFSWILRLAGHLDRKLNLTGQRLPVFSEKSFSYDTDIESVRSPVILDGFFQSERYFSSISTQISEQFSLQHEPKGKAAEMLAMIRATDSICVHIRRGDYITNSVANSYHGTCDLDYYWRGLAEVGEGLTNPRCFIFSDDPRWVRENFKSQIPMTFVDIHGAREVHEDLRLMRECRHFVIANSSLSWWGAWLCAREGKRVVAPKRWFKTSKNDTSDLIPAGWSRV